MARGPSFSTPAALRWMRLLQRSGGRWTGSSDDAGTPDLRASYLQAMDCAGAAFGVPVLANLFRVHDGRDCEVWRRAGRRAWRPAPPALSSVPHRRLRPGPLTTI